MPSKQVILGLGSNVGDRQGYLKKAVEKLYSAHDLGLSDLTVSSMIEVPALLPKDAPPEWDVPFLNMVVAADTSAPPNMILSTVKNIEVELGREDRGHWGPREIDIDILCLGDLIMMTKALTIPHPEMQKRDFVLTPLAEILPDWEHPVSGKTAPQLLQELKTAKK